MTICRKLAVLATISLAIIACVDCLPNQVTHVDLQATKNRQTHMTHLYRVTGPRLVLRRGEELDTIIHLQAPFNESSDQIRFEMAYGPMPQVDKKTLIFIPLEKTTKTTDNWSARLTGVNNEKLNVQIKLPANMAVGVWRLRVSTKKVNSLDIRTFVAQESLFIIFNPYHPLDQVYMPRDDARREYVQSEIGKIYSGTWNRPTGKQWTYGQFHPAVLPTIMVLLDRTRLDISSRGDVVKVARAVSASINSHDDNGLLVGNWSGNYGDGSAPWHWTDSSVIFEKYMLSGYRPVKFAQCWVFGGVLTSALRTLGIPARAITNFMSAHDTDSSLTVDKFFSQSGSELKSVNGDSIWNFHVWSDAWMVRKDLPPGFGGWQALDSTPQEQSMKMYQLGPASLEAIKQGKVDFAYDVEFVYSEVNADLVHWRLDGSSKWRKFQSMSNHVGKLMLTKKIGVMDNWSTYSASDAENILSQYKYEEGSAEERASYHRATAHVRELMNMG